MTTRSSSSQHPPAAVASTTSTTTSPARTHTPSAQPRPDLNFEHSYLGQWNRRPLRLQPLDRLGSTRTGFFPNGSSYTYISSHTDFYFARRAPDGASAVYPRRVSAPGSGFYTTITSRACPNKVPRMLGDSYQRTAHRICANMTNRDSDRATGSGWQSQRLP